MEATLSDQHRDAPLSAGGGGQPTSAGHPRWALLGHAYGAVIAVGLLGTAGLFAAGRLAGGWLGAVTSPWAFQCTLAFAFVLVAALAARRRLAAFAAGAGLAWSAAVVATAWGLAPITTNEPPHPGSVTFRVASANVLFSNQPDARKVAALSALGADVVVLVECSPAWAEALASLEPSYPYQARFPRDDAGGVAIASRFPLHDVHLPRALRTRFDCVDAVVESPGGPVRILGIHPMSPGGPNGARIRDEELVRLATRARSSRLPTMVIGDFNETPYGRGFHRFAEESGCSPASPGGLFRGTWPTSLGGYQVPHLLRIAIDHAFLSPGLQAERVAVGDDIGSDHLPIVVDVVRTHGRLVSTSTASSVTAIASRPR